MYNIPSYFKYKTDKKGNIILYHGLRDKNFEYVLDYDELTPKVSADAPRAIWLSSDKGDKSFSHGYRNLLKIHVPVEMFNSGRFIPMNSIDVTTDDPIKLKDFEVHVLKLCGIDMTDVELLKHQYSMFEAMEPKKAESLFQKIYGDGNAWMMVKEFWSIASYSLFEGKIFDQKLWSNIYPKKFYIG